MTQPTIKLTQKSVNSKMLAHILDIAIRSHIDDYGEHLWSDTHRGFFLEVIEDTLCILVENNKITQWDVVGDSRNNKLTDLENGCFNLLVKYKQINCVNTTQLMYEIQTNRRK